MKLDIVPLALKKKRKKKNLKFTTFQSADSC